MSTDDPRRFSWFCNNEIYGGLQFIKDGDECDVNFAAFLLHLIFVIIAFIILSCCFCFGKSLPHVPRWTGHFSRWVITGVIFLCGFVSIADGILSQMVRNDNGSTIQPQFYLPGSMLVLSTMVSLIYNRLAERSSSPRICWLPLLYWASCIGINSWRLGFLLQDEVAFNVAVLWLTIIKIVCFIMLLVLELYIIFIKDGQSYVMHDKNYNAKMSTMKFREDYVSFLVFVTLWWMNWLFRLGFKRPLEKNDIGTLPDNHRAQHLYEIFKEDFHREMNKKSDGSQPSVWKVFWHVYRKEIIYAGLNRLVYEFGSIIGPLLLNLLVLYVIQYDQLKQVDAHPFVTVTELFENGYVLIAVIFVANMIQFFTYQHNLYLSNLTGIHIRTSLQTMVYDKALRLSSYSISGGSMTVGQITNHMSVDAYNMFFFSQRMHYLWAVPLRVILVVGLLYQQVDYAAFIGIAAILFAVIFQLISARLQKSLQKVAMKHSDERLKRSNEALLGIKLLKMYGWEEMFCKSIEAVRKLEMSSILKFNAAYTSNILGVHFTNIAVNLVVFVSYPYITGKSLEPNSTFAALALINLLNEPLYFVPMVNSLLVNAFIGARRLQTFLLAPEAERSGDIPWNSYFNKDKKVGIIHQETDAIGIDADEKTPMLRQSSYGTITPEPVIGPGVNADTEAETTLRLKGTQNTFAIKIENGSFAWGSSESEPVLKNINLEILPGELTMIVGPVGSGKSSLLSAILGEMTTLNGTIQFGTDANNGIAYGAQKAWLKNATLQDNVLFGMPYNQSRYRKVIEACALKPDIDILPGGDMTEIGEKGINLSGGQKQRVSVARTMYSDKPIVLLDDPLSALDVNVGGHLFRDGIIRRLRKANRTVVLITHQLQYLQQAGKIIIMKDGRIHYQGDFDQISSAAPDIYQKWQDDVIASATSGDDSTGEERDSLQKQVKLLRKRITPSEGSSEMISMDDKNKIKGKLMVKEELVTGSVAGNTYLYYIINMGLLWAFMMPLGRFVMEAGYVWRNFQLTDWSEAGLDTNRTVDSISHEFVGPYIGASVLSLVGGVLYVICLAVSTWNTARAVHLKMLRNIIRSPSRFFDTTPIGRILNRFSSDTQIIDSKLILTIGGLHNFAFMLISAVVVNIILAPVVIAIIIPIVLVYAIIAIHFIRSSRELQRLDSVTRSPIFAHVSETLGGLTTVRSYKEQHHFFNILLERIDANNAVFQYIQAAYAWLGLQMSMCGGLLVLTVGLTSTLQATVFGTQDPTSVGLALTYVLLISQQLFNVIRFACDLQIQLNPVERVQYYATTPTENYDGTEPSMNWPHRGEILLEGISVRYASTLPSVLRDVSLYVKPGEKIGICGRTGSGKSSLTLALLRMIDTYKGKIIIDGEDIAQMPLTTLRQRLSIIPQDPILFTGTIRSNLDPLGLKSDDKLWTAIEIAQLKNVVSELELGLDTPVSEGGENFSVGQRQLFCLARAFLRNSRVLIMDEATASIDYATENVLQEVVASAFKEKTVLTIAHRVSTIIGSDTIWVLRDGKIVECDSPDRLLADKTTEFYSMVEANK